MVAIHPYASGLAIGLRPRKPALAQLQKALLTATLAMAAYFFCLHTNAHALSAQDGFSGGFKDLENFDSKPVDTNTTGFAKNIFTGAPSLPKYLYSGHDSVVPGSTPISPFTPPTAQYQSWEDMTKLDKRFALAQVAVIAVGHNLDNRVGRAILRFQEPLKFDKAIKCRQKVSLKRYYVNCGLKF